jgi:hypothetical protein
MSGGRNDPGRRTGVVPPTDGGLRERSPNNVQMIQAARRSRGETDAIRRQSFQLTVTQAGLTVTQAGLSFA